MSARAYAVMPHGDSARAYAVMLGDHREQIVELFENTACDCYFYLRYNNTT